MDFLRLSSGSGHGFVSHGSGPSRFFSPVPLNFFWGNIADRLMCPDLPPLIVVLLSWVNS